MAIIDPRNATSDEQPQQQAGPAATPQGGVGGVGSQAGAPTKKASSGRFTNVSQYLQASKGAGDKLANAVGGQTTKDLNKSTKQVQDANTSVRSAVDSERDRIAQASGFANQVQQDPIQITGNEQQMTQFQNLYNPSGMSAQQQAQMQQNAGQANTAIQNAQQQVGNLSTEAGRMAALQKVLARPTYTQGQQTLDQLLFQVGGAQNLNQQRQQLGQQVGNLAKAQDQFLTGITGDIAANKAAELDASNLLRKAVSDQTAAFDKAQIDEATAANTENARLNELYRQYILGNTTGISQADMSTIQNALNLGNDFKTYGVTRGDAYKDYLQNMRTDLTAKDVVDANELARSQALASLANVTGNYSAVGDRGPTAGINAALLQANSAASREALLQDLVRASANGLNVGVNANNGLGTGKVDTLTYGGPDFLKNIVQNIENNQQGSVGANVTGAYNHGLSHFNAGMSAILDWDKISPAVRDERGVAAIGQVREGSAPSSRYVLNNYLNNFNSTGTGLQIDANGNLVAMNPNYSGQGINYTGAEAVNTANQQGAGAIQDYLNRLLNAAGYFDTLGTAQSDQSLFGKMGKAAGVPDTGKGK